MSLVASSLSYAVAGNEIVHGVEMALEPHQLTVLIGPNGSGKTTLLRLMNGELEPTEGAVELSGIDVNEIDLEERARRFAVLPQTSALDFPFTVKEVVAMGRIPHQLHHVKNEQVVDDVIERLNLSSLKNRIYTTMSGGEKQRTQLARVLVQLWDRLPDGYFFLDEPNSAMDLAHHQHLFRSLRYVADEGASVLVVLHDINLALRYADQIGLMSEGKLIAFGKPEDVVQPKLINQTFSVDVELLDTGVSGRPLLIVRD